MRFKELRQALYSRVDAQVGASVVAVYAKVPQAAQSEDNSAFPYITIGAFTASPFDTDDESGVTVLADVSVWSRDTSVLATSDIVSAVYAALHKHDLSITGANTVDCLFNSMNELDDPDGLTTQDVLTFRITYDAI